MKHIKELLKISGNPDADIIENGIPYSDVSGYVDTGNYAVNAVVSGSIYKGYPRNKILAFAGEESVGKTYVVLSAAKEFLNKHKDGYVMIFETEGALTKDMMQSRGIDTNRTVIFPVSTVQEMKFQAIKMVDHYASEKMDTPLLFILDSLGNLSTTKEMADTSEGKETQDMTRSRVIKAAFRTLTLKLGKAGIPFLITNHTYDTQELFSKKVMSGGSGLKYTASIIIFLSKSKDKKDAVQIGNNITFRVGKSRFTKENSSVTVNLNFTTGLDRYSGLLDIALLGGVFTKEGNKVVLPNGEKLFESKIDNNPATYYTKDVLDKIDEVCQKHFLYQASTVEDVNSDLEEETDETTTE